MIAGIKGTFGARGAVGYPFPLAQNLTAAPEVSYYFPFNQVKTDYQWKIASVEGGVAIRYGIYKPEPPPPPPPPTPPPPPPPKPKPEPPVATVATASPQHIEIVETIMTETFPLLPYIFFDSAGSQLAQKYEQLSPSDLDRFRSRELPHSSLEAYYQILNVLGNRLIAEPNERITIVGTTDGAELAAGSKSTALAKERAERVKQYLTETWAIEPSRIITKTVATPANPSSKVYDEGVQENRRVEIISTNGKMLEPIVHEKFSRYDGSPRLIPFVMSAKSKQPIANWEFKITAGDALLYHTNGNGTPPSTFGWSISNADLPSIAQANDQKAKLSATLSVKDESGLSNVNSFEVPVSKSRFPFELSRLSLVVFDFDKSTISKQNQQMISTFVSHSIKAESEARITGSTDRLGELDHNQELSQARADAVGELVKAENPDAKLTEIKGIGPAETSDLNATPEGRYYCRTVTVQVQTPLK